MQLEGTAGTGQSQAWPLNRPRDRASAAWTSRWTWRGRGDSVGFPKPQFPSSGTWMHSRPGEDLPPPAKSDPSPGRPPGPPSLTWGFEVHVTAAHSPHTLTRPLLRAPFGVPLLPFRARPEQPAVCVQGGCHNFLICSSSPSLRTGKDKGPCSPRTVRVGRPGLSRFLQVLASQGTQEGGSGRSVQVQTPVPKGKACLLSLKRV